MSKLVDSIKHAVFTEDETPAPTPAPQAAPSFQHVTTPSYSPSSSITPGMQDDLYEKLKKNTGFDQASSIQKVMDLQKPLESIITDPVVRLKAAFAQASSQGITSTNITSDLDKLSQIIKQEADKFHMSFDREKSAIEADENHATQMEQQLHDLRVAIADRKTKLDRADTGFASALARRQSELEQLSNQFSVLK